MNESPSTSAPGDSAAAQSWVRLFAPDIGATRVVRFRILRKRGEPLLILPADNRCAAQALALYPAQTTRARWARNLARLMFTVGFAPTRERGEARIALAGPLAGFLRAQAGTAELPRFAVLNGNPQTPGRRFVILVFGADAQPVAIIKAGVGSDAARLIQKESAFLKSLAKTLPGIPGIRAEFFSPPVAAFVTDFIPGDSPRAGDATRISELLTAWLDRERTILLGELPQWRRLQQAHGDDPVFAALQEQLRAQPVHPAIAHGDFAPWNIKVSPAGAWTVLDWERGEQAGIPGWDWFHFTIQSGLLAHRRPPTEIAAKVEALLESADFCAYATTAGINGIKRALAQAYLGYMLRVIRPSEGLATTEELLKMLAQRWRDHH